MAEGGTQSAEQPPAEARITAVPAMAAGETRRPVLPRPLSVAALPAVDALPAPIVATPSFPAKVSAPIMPINVAMAINPGNFHSGDPEMRLRDLLAFAHAAEAGGTQPDIAALRLRAEGELNAYAFRLLHNRVEDIRREAMQEQVASIRPTLSFSTLVAANVVALAAAGIGVLLFWALLAAAGGR